MEFFFGLGEVGAVRHSVRVTIADVTRVAHITVSVFQLEPLKVK